MAWTRIPPEHHPLFRAAVPADPRIVVLAMFGGLCATANGNMFAGLWADTVAVRLPEADRARVLAAPGGKPFDPMGKGKPMAEMVLLPPAVLHAASVLRDFMGAALEYTLTLPPKKKKKPAGKRRPRT